MSADTPITCKGCGGSVSLHCGEFMPGDSLDLTLHCDDECGAPVLNAFVAFEDFVPVE